MEFETISSPVVLTSKDASGEFRFGIEEEFFLVNRETGEVATEAPAGLFALANMATEGLVEREFLQSQVEITTPPLLTGAQAKNELSYVRGVLARFAAFHKLQLAACGTHPLAKWRAAQQSDKPRYDNVMHDLQVVGRRNVFCGLHVHVEVPDPARRIELMSHLVPHLPLLLALSASSPFWEGQLTGMKAYRMAGYSEQPRSGIPEDFDSAADYDTYVAALIASGAIKDSSFICWMLRPSSKYPTLELRAPDSCTRLEDAVAIASLYRALVRHLFYNPPPQTHAALWRALSVDNKWQAQRHGTEAVFATPHGPKTVAQWLEEVLDMVHDDAQILGCEAEVKHCSKILQQGTSADAQIDVYERTPHGGAQAVAEWITSTTVA